MDLKEYQGKEIFKKYNIPVPAGVLLRRGEALPESAFPVVVKVQAFFGQRKNLGGIKVVHDHEQLTKICNELLTQTFSGGLVEELLIEEYLPAAHECYLAIQYSTDTRTPVLLFSDRGGTGIEGASSHPLDILADNETNTIGLFLKQEHVPTELLPGLIDLSQNLWQLFRTEKALLAEINPVIVTKDSRLVAVDSKIILDDAVTNPTYRPMLDLGGDIAVVASGGGASMLNIDILVRSGGKPANYVEYSGNPPASVVEEITLSVLSRPGLRGAWVVGGTANFTDIYETMVGFVNGLRKVEPKLTIPIVIRRDGPRAEEARRMLHKIATDEGYDITVFGPEVSMADSAKMLMQKMQNKK